MSSGAAPPTRMTIRQSEAQDRRHRLTSRRQEMTNKIRKQKKSQYLAKKRNLPVSVTATTTNNINAQQQPSPRLFTPTSVVVSNIKDLIFAYCRSPSDKSLLQNLHDGLKMAPPLALKNDDNPLIFFSQQDDDDEINSAAVPFLKFLKQSLQVSSISSSSNHDNTAATTIPTTNLVLEILVWPDCNILRIIE